MTHYDFIVDIKNRILKIDNEEIFLSMPDCVDHKVQKLFLTEDLNIPPNCESIASANNIGPGGLIAVLVEPQKISGVFLTRYLVKGNHNIVLVNVANPNKHRVILKEGVNFGTC